MSTSFLQHLKTQLQDIRDRGLYKEERIIRTPQRASIGLTDGKNVLNLCANNYLGLADHPEVIQSAHEGLDLYGMGMASVRFICGTGEVHKALEKRTSDFLGTEDTIVYGSCFDANGGLFETLLGPEDAIISDSLNHASIIDGVRLCKAKRFRYQNNDMEDLEAKLQSAQEARFRIIATDGVFSMDGIVANLASICDLADKYRALVMVDDCHATGFMGEKGKGTHEYCGVMGRVDLLTGTYGKALGGASGGYTSGRKEIIEWLRQRSRPYLFSNALCPAIAHSVLKVFDILEQDQGPLKTLRKNAEYFRRGMTRLGFDLVPGHHPIIPVMLGDARLAQEMARRLLDYGIYVIGFSYPVVPEGQARIRTQMSAAHSQEDLDRAMQAFEQVGKELQVTTP